MHIFNGITFASGREEALKQRVADLRGEGVELKIAAVLFYEDEGSVLYSSKKKEAAARVGIEYELHQFSMLDPVEGVVSLIEELNSDESVTGIIVQKPTRSSFRAQTNKDLNEQTSKQKDKPINIQNAQRATHNESRITNYDFDQWWSALTSAIVPGKDVDGLSPVTMAAIADNTWEEKGMVLPATCGAVLEILELVGSREQAVGMTTHSPKVIILGKSDLLGRPLYYVLKNQGVDVELIGRKELESRIMNHEFLLDADIIVSSTGRPGLITGEMVSQGVVIIDAGEPQGDVDFASVKDKASIITPVPGGVGPVTVVELLGNCFEL